MNRFSQILSPAMFGLLGQLFGLTAAFYSGGLFLVATMLGFAGYASTSGKFRKRDEKQPGDAEGGSDLSAGDAGTVNDPAASKDPAPIRREDEKAALPALKS